MADRQRPNILVTGTPGTGKTTTCERVAQETGFKHINVGDWVKEKGLHSGWDEEFQCFVLDEDKVCDELEDVLAEGGCIVDHHGCDFFPERGYSEQKINTNMECEIMMVVLEEATESYKQEIVRPLRSNNVEEMEQNIQMLVDWIKANV